jgi:beta-lactamase superfamily II metal-dependent hydrolase
MGELLALQQVSTINNTSLVFALELTESGKVLLFVGDAEEESWQTWENKNTNLNKLLANTVVYKVGHHGSINATDQEVLQNKMTHPDLVALIPVDMKRADEKNWEFPAKSLYDLSNTDVHQKGLLFKQTHGRILLNCDQEGCKDSDPCFETDNPWPGKISMDPAPEKLWVDYTLTLG